MSLHPTVEKSRTARVARHDRRSRRVHLRVGASDEFVVVPYREVRVAASVLNACRQDAPPLIVTDIVALAILRAAFVCLRRFHRGAIDDEACHRALLGAVLSYVRAAPSLLVSAGLLNDGASPGAREFDRARKALDEFVRWHRQYTAERRGGTVPHRYRGVEPGRAFGRWTAARLQRVSFWITATAHQAGPDAFRGIPCLPRHVRRRLSKNGVSVSCEDMRNDVVCGLWTYMQSGAAQDLAAVPVFEVRRDGSIRLRMDAIRDAHLKAANRKHNAERRVAVSLDGEHTGADGVRQGLCAADLADVVSLTPLAEVIEAEEHEIYLQAIEALDSAAVDDVDRRNFGLWREGVARSERVRALWPDDPSTVEARLRGRERRLIGRAVAATRSAAVREVLAQYRCLPAFR